MTLNCSEKGIPERLHQLGRKVLEHFEDNEKLYRRFLTPQSKDCWLESRQLSASIFKIRDDSYNRELFSNYPSDVLFNIHAISEEDHYFDWGILSISVGKIISFSEPIPPSRAFKMGPRHDPEFCMYPHCEVLVFEGGVRIENSPKSIKVKARDLLISNCKIEKEPS